jgi:hypothetical protein
MATKKRPTKKTTTPPPEVPADKVLVLRTCAKDMTSHGGFKWPASGPVSAPDWNPERVCGGGLHGLLFGEGEGGQLDWSEDAKWLVVEVARTSVVDLDGKVKFPRGEVVFCGDRKGATEYIQARRPGAAVCGAAATAGDEGILVLHWWDGTRYRIATFYVGEDGIEPNQPYKLNDQGKPVKVEKSATGKAA